MCRQFAVAARHHDERDGSEQTRETANDDNNKHDSPTTECSGPIANTEVGVLRIV
jgi:hypothetical protein